MTSNFKIVTGLVATLALVAGGLGCSDSGDKRVVADSSSTYRTSDSVSSVSNQPGTTTNGMTPAPTYSSGYSSGQPNTYYRTDDSDEPRRIVRVASDDPAIYGTNATADYDTGSPRTTAYTSSTRSRSTATVQEAPPLLPPEQLPRTPRGDEFWVSSHWRWDGNRYVLEPGRMEQRRSNALYHPANWTQTDQGWEFTPAYWD